MSNMGLFKKNVCEHCNKKFSKKEELMQHLQVIHFKDLPYDCKECKKIFRIWKICEHTYKDITVTKKIETRLLLQF